MNEGQTNQPVLTASRLVALLATMGLTVAVGGNDLAIGDDLAVGGDLTVTGTAAIGGATTITAAAGLTVKQAATQDAVALIGRAGGSSSYVATITPTTLTASRTLTLPDATTVLAGLAVAQTFSAAQTFAATITSTSTGAVLDAPTGTTNAKYLRVTNTSGDIYFGVESNSAGGFFTGSVAYDGVVWTPGRLFLRGASGVAINGAATMSSTLAVTGAATLSSTLAVTGQVTGSYFTASGFNNTAHTLAAGGVNGTCVIMGTGSSYDFSVQNTSGTSAIRVPTGTLRVQIPDTTASTTTGTGALQVGGGAGIVGAVNVGGALDVNANATFTSLSGKFVIGNSTGSYPQIGYNIAPTAAGGATYRATDAANSIFFSGSTIALRVAASGTAGNAITWTTPLSADTSGVAIAGLAAITHTSRPLEIDRNASGALTILGIKQSGSFIGYIGSDGSQPTLYGSGGSNIAARWDNASNFMAGAGALATTSTDGFLYVPTCAGAPTGAPTAKTGYCPIVEDSTNHKLYFYSGGAWRDAGP